MRSTVERLTAAAAIALLFALGGCAKQWVEVASPDGRHETLENARVKCVGAVEDLYAKCMEENGWVEK